MIPTRRDLHFRLKAHSVTQWHEAEPYVAHFANAMSLSFPEGERFFIHTVRLFRDRITDPELQKAVAAFIGQEAMHGREHEAYNRLLAQAGLPVAELEAVIYRQFQFLKAKLPAAAQLSVTIAQEHLTAVFAELLLTEPKLLAGADAELTALWHWHALEEIEHKAVAFDVYETVMGRGLAAYSLRATSLILTTAMFLGLALYYQQRLLSTNGQSRSWRGVRAFGKFLFVSPAMLPRLLGPWLAYLRPGFNPWDHDNRYLLEQMDALVARVEPDFKMAA